jgi:hypothetical protein
MKMPNWIILSLFFDNGFNLRKIIDYPRILKIMMLRSLIGSESVDQAW